MKNFALSELIHRLRFMDIFGVFINTNIKINNAKLLGDKDVNSSDDVGVKFVVKQKKINNNQINSL